MILHLLSTTVMVRLGCVSGNLMTCVRPVSRKLRERGERIVMILAEVDRKGAASLLERTGGDIGRAVELASR